MDDERLFHGIKFKVDPKLPKSVMAIENGKGHPRTYFLIRERSVVPLDDSAVPWWPNVPLALLMVYWRPLALSVLGLVIMGCAWVWL